MESLGNEALKALFKGQQVYLYATEKPVKSGVENAKETTNTDNIAVTEPEVGATVAVENNKIPLAPIPTLAVNTTPPATTKKQVELLIISDQAYSEVQEFLSKILAAVSVSITSETYLQATDNKASMQGFACKRLIVFGDAVMVDSLPRLAPYKAIQGKTMQLMYAGGLKQIESDKSLKLQLWNALKQMFGVA
jgi:DNA polymerase III psi subunit